MTGSVFLRLSDAAMQELRGFMSHPKVVLSRDIRLAFAPTEQIYEERYAALVNEKTPVFLEVGNVLTDNMGEVAFIRGCDHPSALPAERHLVLSTIEGVDPNTAFGVLLGIGDDLSDPTTAYLECQVVFVPSAWATELEARKAASTQGDDDSFVDSPVTEQPLENAPVSLGAMRAEQKRIVASYGPSLNAPQSQTIGARRRYRVVADRVDFSLEGWECTDKRDKPPSVFAEDQRKAEANEREDAQREQRSVRRVRADRYIRGPFLQKPWKVKRTDAKATTAKPTMSIARTGDGIKEVHGTRTIALEMTVGEEWMGRYFRPDGSMNFDAVHLQFRDRLPSRTEYWKGDTRGYDPTYESVTAGAIKINLMGSKKDDLTGVYDVVVKAKVIEYRHAKDPSESRMVVSYMVNAYRCPPGTKATKRLFLESAGRATPENATVIRATGQCQMVLVNLGQPQIMVTEPTSTTAEQ
jgi:hypothetical protein